MLYHLSCYLTQHFSGLNVIHYTSFRTIASLLSTLLLSLLFGNWFITKSQMFFRSKVREDVPESHKIKNDMPTMGGIFIISTVIANILIWCNLTKPEVWIFILCLISFGILGFWDDWQKIHKLKGITGKVKFTLQATISLAISGLWLWLTPCNTATSLYFPFLKNFHPDLGVFFILWMAYMITGFSNAVNLTDGLDGLAIGSLMPNFATFAIIAFLAGHIQISSYLNIPFANCTEVTILCGTLVGASLGFLWFNTYPAQIFMGDVGSLALGAGLALIAIMTKQELLLLISGGLFVIETLSVIFQVISFKLFGKRIFKMAPVHHHFELKGWPEAKITSRFGIISLVLCLLALLTLKLR